MLNGGEYIVDVYRLVSVLQWILAMLATFLSASAVRAWRQRQLARYAGLWWVVVLLAGALQGLLGVETWVGRLNLMSGLGSICALFIARGPAPGRRALMLILAPIIILGSWLALIFATPSYTPHSVDLRRFDADGVARLETAMWRSYYDKQRLRLFLELRELMGVQYRFPRLASFEEAYLATRAAFVFKAGKERPDYQKALPYLERYYEEIARIGNLNFDPKRVAALELEWWIVHRQEDRYSFEELATACARMMAEMYGADLGRLMEHGRLRAEAMKIRDRNAVAGGLTDADWQQIERLLQGAYRSLYHVVNQTAAHEIHRVGAGLKTAPTLRSPRVWR